MRPSRTSAANGGRGPALEVAGADDVDVAVDDQRAPAAAPRSVPTVIGRPSQWCHGGIIGWSRSDAGVGLPLVDPRAEVAPARRPTNSCSARLLVLAVLGARGEVDRHRVEADEVAHELDEVVERARPRRRRARGRGRSRAGPAATNGSKHKALAISTQDGRTTLAQWESGNVPVRAHRPAAGARDRGRADPAPRRPAADRPRRRPAARARAGAHLRRRARDGAAGAARARGRRPGREPPRAPRRARS